MQLARRTDFGPCPAVHARVRLGAREAERDGPADGFLRALVRPDGVSILATLDSERARSPIDRYGTIAFVRSVHAGETVTLTAESRDSPEIVGEACLSMDLLPPGDSGSLRAEQAFAAAARSVAAGELAHALNQYLDAAREFDRVDRFRAAEARHAMAEIANVPLAHEDDAFWLARSALAGYATGSLHGAQREAATGPHQQPARPPGSHADGVAALHRQRASRARARSARAKPPVGQGRSLRRTRAAACRHFSRLHGLPRRQQLARFRLVRESRRAM